MAIYIPNETSNRIVLAGVETIPGVAVTPDFRLLGEFTASKSAALSRTPEATGGYDRLATPKRGAVSFSGSYSEAPTYVSLAQLLRVSLRGGDTGTLVSGSTGAYQYTKSPSFDTDDVETMTVQENVPGLGFQATGVRFSDFNISMDADDTGGAWQYSAGQVRMRSYDDLPGAFEGVVTSATATTVTMTGAAFVVDDWVGAYYFANPGSHIGAVRQIESNTADTLTFSTPFEPDEIPEAGDTFRIEAMFPAGLPIPNDEAIASYGTKVFLDPVGEIGTTNVAPHRVISANITVSQTLTDKRFLGNGMDEVSSRVGKGAREVTGQIRLEFDRRDELLQWKNLDEFSLRFEQEGDEIDSGIHNRVRIDVPRAVWDDYTRDTRAENLTVTMGWVAYLPPSGNIVTFDVINDQPVLP